ncbi:MULTISPECIES: ABC transporter permease [unclassified Chelatococcus]|uniref:ABC transporter permease n=1 Tax=unclassified Chelatococcus TaxID=2638111 RepID=UPI001BCDE09A|nr:MULTISPECIES: ABC transporter permease [unclassified Chelatococcus]MBS7699412.1 ABC transporter permease [Chelatococcus sp. YT9]MBX3557696.1 ABC transporter permease [Chelatococcus sp.]
MRVTMAALRITATLLLAWQALIWIGRPPAYIVPPPLDVAAVFLRQPSFLLANSLITLSEIMAGFALGAVLGMGTAIAIAALPRFGRLVWPLMLVLQAFPVFVLAPVLVLWFGFGLASKVVMTTIIIFFPVASAFADGLRRTDPDLLDATALTTATHWQTLIHVRLPLALPFLASGLKVAAPLAPLGAVVGEWVGASAGLGFVMVQANARMQTETMFAAMLILAAVTLALRAIVDHLTPYLTPWTQNT